MKPIIVLKKDQPWPRIPARNLGLSYVPEKDEDFTDVANKGIVEFDRLNMQLPTRLIIGFEAHRQMRMDHRIYQTDSLGGNYEGLVVEVSRDAGIELH